MIPLQISDNITLLAGAVLIGTIDYWLYNQLNLLGFFNQTNNDEKVTLITLLGLVNYFTFFVVGSLNELFSVNLNIIGIFIVTIIMAKFFQLMILYGVKKISKFVFKNYYKGKRPYTFYTSGIEEVLNAVDCRYIYGYVCDYENNILGHGYISHNPKESNSSESYLSLTLPDQDIDIKDDKNSDHPIDLNSCDELFIDFNRKIKLYLIYVE